MSIQVQRVFVREAAGGRLSHHTPGGFTFDLVIEATAAAPGDAGNSYLPILAYADFSQPPTALAALFPPQPATTVGGAGWTTIGGRFELVLPITIGPLSAADQTAVRDHLLKYFVVLRDITPGKTDADGAESEIFILA